MKVYNENEILIIKIDHKKPIELFDLANTCIALNNNYKRFIKDTKRNNEELKLYINSLENGSKIIEVFYDNSIKLVKDFVLQKYNEHLDKKVKNILSQEFDGISVSELKEIASIHKTTSKDYNSGVSLSVSNNNSTVNNYYYNGIQSKAIVEACKQQVDSLEQVNQQSIYNGVVMTLAVADKTQNQSNLDRVVIDEISPLPVKTIWLDNSKHEAINISENPFNKYWIVDVQVLRTSINNKIVGYKILNIIDMGDIE